MYSTQLGFMPCTELTLNLRNAPKRNRRLWIQGLQGRSSEIESTQILPRTVSKTAAWCRTRCPLYEKGYRTLKRLSTSRRRFLCRVFGFPHNLHAVAMGGTRPSIRSTDYHEVHYCFKHNGVVRRKPRNTELAAITQLRMPSVNALQTP